VCAIAQKDLGIDRTIEGEIYGEIVNVHSHEENRILWSRRGGHV
jgi:hypothetical protein